MVVFDTVLPDWRDLPDYLGPENGGGEENVAVADAAAEIENEAAETEESDLTIVPFLSNADGHGRTVFLYTHIYIYIYVCVCVCVCSGFNLSTHPCACYVSVFFRN